jgi:hypothetical protein
MLTAKENMRAVVKGGKPDRLVNQYEALQLLFYPYAIHSNSSCAKGEMNKVDVWGVTRSFPENVPGAFPVHTPDKIVVKDIETWRDFVHAPVMDYPQEEWDMFKEMYNQVDNTKAYRTAFYAPGLFEMSHYLCSMTDALEYYLTDPDEMKDLIKYLTDFELQLAEQLCSQLHPDAILHHDDWGSAKNSFLRPNMFEDFFVEPYKQIYGYFHDHGVELIVHHSDSYAANLVPSMIEMGIDVWQGCIESNDVPALIKQYGDKITFMGAIDNKSVDFNGWTDENCKKEVLRTIEACGDQHFIPCITQGGPGSVYPGVYMSLADHIDAYNAEHYGLDIEEIRNARLPHQIMF